MAKKRRVLNEDELKKLRYFSGIRLPNEHMAAMFGMKKDAFEHMIGKDAVARSALEEGRGAASNKIRGLLYIRATEDKDFQALKFWCETQEGFAKTENLNISGSVEISAISDEELENRTAKAIARIASRKNGKTE